MKKYLLVIIIFLISIHSLPGRSEMTQARYACNLVEAAIWDEFLNEGKNLPSSWNDIPSFTAMKNSITTQNLNTLEYINDLALVPKAPLIQVELGISMDHSDWRLFAISRAANLHFPQSNKTSPDKGRYAILVAADGTKTRISWISESEVQIILKQIKDFDPEKQPLAFENVDQLTRDRKTRKDQADQESKEHLRRIGKLGPDDKLIYVNPKSESRINYGPWIVTGIIFSCFLSWMAFRKRVRR